MVEMLEKNNRLHLRLLGSCEIKSEDGDIRFESNKARALLIYLVMNPGAHQRNKLMGLFWGDFPDANARRNLRHALWNLRQKIDRPDFPSTFIADHQTIAITSEADIWLDVTAFQHEINQYSGDQGESALSALSSALELYRGGFLAGFYVRKAGFFDEWALVERERLRTLAMTGLQHLSDGYAERGEIGTALNYARRLLTLTPWREETHRQVMGLLNTSGQPEAAMAQYEECRRLLGEELGVEPAKETTKLFEKIKGRKSYPSSDQPGKGIVEHDDFITIHSSLLPIPSTPFVGRLDELADITDVLDDPACRLLTITGPGGIGKTRLALQVAAQKNAAFSQGVFFVPLAEQYTTQELVSTVIFALGFTPFVQPDPKIQMLNYLCDRQLLLVLDNFEHLTDQSLFLAEILQSSPGVKILLTSRERLNLQAEWIYPLEGLTDENSVKLFTQSARRVRLGFKLSTENNRHVVRVCQTLYGLPLAIEMAAAWVNTHTCNEIAEKIEDYLASTDTANLELLTSQWRDIPERHRSLRAVFDYSWDLLDETEKDVFVKLSLFCGSFRRVAAEQIAGASLKTLLALGDKSLLQHRPNGRYELHGLSREYAAARLRQPESQFIETTARHAQYYATYTQEQAKSEDLNYSGIEADIDNIRAAWEWALAHRDENIIEQLFRGLYVFYEVRSAFQQGDAIFSQAMDALGFESDFRQFSLEEESLLSWQLVAPRAAFICRLGQYELALAALELCLSAFRYHNARRDLAFTLFYLGDITRLIGDHQTARDYLQEGLQLFNELDDRGGMGFCLNVLGVIASAKQEFTQAKKLLEQSRMLFNNISHLWGLAIVNINLGSLFKVLQEYPMARQHLQESLSLCQKLNHRWALATCFTHLGDILRIQGEIIQAQNHYQEALRLQKEIGDRRGTLVVLMGIEAILTEQNKIEWAVKILTVIQHNASDFSEIQEQAKHRLADLVEQYPNDGNQYTKKNSLDRSIDMIVDEFLSKKNERWGIIG